MGHSHDRWVGHSRDFFQASHNCSIDPQTHLMTRVNASGDEPFIKRDIFDRKLLNLFTVLVSRC